MGNKRFTVRVDGVAYIKNADGTIMSGDVIDRLAAYKDIEMEPEDIETIKAVYVPDHQELKEYRSIGTREQFRAALRRTAEMDCSECIVTSGANEASGQHIRDLLTAEEEGRLVVKPKCSECRYEKDVIGRCFHCLGSQQLEPDRSEAALGGGEGG